MFSKVPPFIFNSFRLLKSSSVSAERIKVSKLHPFNVNDVQFVIFISALFNNLQFSTKIVSTILEFDINVESLSQFYT
jgi:hypothetical protein